MCWVASVCELHAYSSKPNWQLMLLLILASPLV